MKYIPATVSIAGFALAYLAIGDIQCGAGGVRWAQMIIGGVMMIGGCIAGCRMAKEKAANRAGTRKSGRR